MSFCIVGNVKLLPGKFTTEYESVLLKGVANARLTSGERMAALLRLVDKLSPDFKELGAKFTEFSGKCKHVPAAD